MSPGVRAAGRWTRSHWRTPALVLSLVACVTLGFTQGQNNARDDRQDSADTALIAQLATFATTQAEDRIAADVASCESGNRLRADIREFAAEVAARPGALELVNERFKDRDCSAIPGGTVPPSITTPPTEDPP